MILRIRISSLDINVRAATRDFWHDAWHLPSTMNFGLSETSKTLLYQVAVTCTISLRCCRLTAGARSLAGRGHQQGLCFPSCGISRNIWRGACSATATAGNHLFDLSLNFRSTSLSCSRRRAHRDPCFGLHWHQTLWPEYSGPWVDPGLVTSCP